MAKLAKLTEENLVRLYVEGKKSLEDIAKTFHLWNENIINLLMV